MFWRKKKKLEPMTVERLLNMSKEEIGHLQVHNYLPVDVVWMLLDYIKENKK